MSASSLSSSASRYICEARRSHRRHSGSADYRRCAALRAAANPSGREVVSPSAYVSLEPVARGSSFQLAVVLKIRPAFTSTRASIRRLPHSHRSPRQSPRRFQIPGEISYPKGELRTFAFTKTPLNVYEDKVILRVPLSAQSDAPLGAQHVPLKLRYQACNNEVCLRPSLSMSMPRSPSWQAPPIPSAHPELFLPSNIFRWALWSALALFTLRKDNLLYNPKPNLGGAMPDHLDDFQISCRPQRRNLACGHLGIKRSSRSTIKLTSPSSRHQDQGTPRPGRLRRAALRRLHHLPSRALRRRGLEARRGYRRPQRRADRRRSITSRTSAAPSQACAKSTLLKTPNLDDGCGLYLQPAWTK